MPNCSVCPESGTSTGTTFVCTVCKGSYHLLCGGITETAFRRLTMERRAQLKCKKCATVPVGTSSQAQSPVCDVSNDNPVGLDNSDFMRTQHAIIAQNNKILDTITFMSKQYEDILCRVRELEDKNMVLTKQNSSLESRIDLLEGQLENIERSARAKNVEVRGISETNGESLKNIFHNICQTIKSKVDTSHIEAAYRTQKHKNGPIVFKLTSNHDRDQLLSDLKAFHKQASSPKEKLNTLNVGIAGPSSPIYVAEHLTFRANHLWYLARQATKEKKVKYAWIKAGQIYVRRDIGTPAILVSNADKLALLSPNSPKL